MIVKEDFWPAELLLWKELVYGTVRSNVKEENADTSSDRRVRAEVIWQLATNRVGEPMQGLPIIHLEDVEIVGKLNFEACKLESSLIFERCDIGDINLDQAEAPGLVVTNSKIRSLTAQQVQTGNIILSGSTVTSRVALLDAHLKGVLDLTSARLMNREVALNGHNMEVDGDLLAGDCKAEGSVKLTGAQIGGFLKFAGATLSDGGGSALIGSCLSVGQDMLCRGLMAHGVIRLDGAQIKGSLDLDEATIESGNNQFGHALFADLLTVGRNIECRKANVNGQFRVPGADIGARLDLGGTVITNINKRAFFARGLKVNEDLKCDKGFTVVGTTSLASARIGGKLNFDNAAFMGPLNLESAMAHRLADKGVKWPEEIILRDFEYHSFSGIDERESVKERLAWLTLHRNEGSLSNQERGYSPQIYNKLAEAYRAGGYDDAAREVLITKLRVRSTERRRILSGPLKWPRRFLNLIVNRVMDWTVSYGYRPLRIIWWGLGMLVLGGFLFQTETNDFVPKTGVNPEPVFYAPLYALDLLLPVAGIGHRGYFLTVEQGVWSATAFILMGWFFALVLVAGISGVFKRD